MSATYVHYSIIFQKSVSREFFVSVATQNMENFMKDLNGREMDEIVDKLRKRKSKENLSDKDENRVLSDNTNRENRKRKQVLKRGDNINKTFPPQNSVVPVNTGSNPAF